MGEIIPRKINKLILIGLLLNYLPKSKFLLKIGYLFKNIIPYHLLYIIFAYILLPKRNHKISREFLIKEANNLGGKEFLTWFEIICNYNNDYKISNYYNSIDKVIVMGREERMFLKPAIEFCNNCNKSKLIIVEKAGYIVNIDTPNELNNILVNRCI